MVLVAPYGWCRGVMAGSRMNGGHPAHPRAHVHARTRECTLHTRAHNRYIRAPPAHRDKVERWRKAELTRVCPSYPPTAILTPGRMSTFNSVDEIEVGDLVVHIGRPDLGVCEVRQLRHHFGPSLRDVWALYHPTHAVYCALLGCHAYWMPIGACDPML